MEAALEGAEPSIHLCPWFGEPMGSVGLPVFWRAPQTPEPRQGMEGREGQRSHQEEGHGPEGVEKPGVLFRIVMCGVGKVPGKLRPGIGMTLCTGAKGILSALDQVKTDVPMVARLVGTNEEEGRDILASANMPTAATLADAAKKAVAAARA